MADRWRVLAAALSTRGRRFTTRDALERHQQNRLRQVLGRASRVFPHYRALAGASLAEYPVLDKATWLAHFDGLNDRGLRLDDCRAAALDGERSGRFDAELAGVSLGLSSGTSGQRGVFLTTPHERARWAGTMLARALPSLREPTRVALVLRSGGPLYESIESRRVAFEHVDLGLPPDEIAARLAAFAPTVLAAPPQALDDLAARHRDGRSSAPEPDSSRWHSWSRPLAPTTIFSIADVLDDEVAARVEAAFGVPVGQVYQATEGFLGITCTHGTLHLNEDLLVVERQLLDAASGRFSPIITDLYRSSQAIIRYRLDDVLIPGPDNCPCGSVFATVARVEGRADDVPWFVDASGGRQPLFAGDVRTAILAAPGVQDFRLVQRSDGGLRLAVRPQRAQASGHVALQRLIAARGLELRELTGMPWPVESRIDKRRQVRREPTQRGPEQR